MSSFVIHSHDKTSRLGAPTGVAAGPGLAFDDECLIALRVDEQGPEAALIQEIDLTRDLFYHVPGSITPELLEREIELHIPKALRAHTSHRPLASTLGDAILIQIVEGNAPYLSPLTALSALLNATGSVRTGILHAACGGLLFVHRTLDGLRARVRPISIQTFVAMSPAERREVFPGFEPEGIMLSGPDLDRVTTSTAAEARWMRRAITIDDLKTALDISAEAEAMIADAPHRYTLVTGAAAIYAAVRREARAPQGVSSAASRA